MQYYSTRNKDLRVSLRDAVLNGLAPDGGLFMPVTIPTMKRADLESIRSSSLAETGKIVARYLFGEDIKPGVLDDITESALNFETPVVTVSDRLLSLELFHGPTLAFKDVGARFMARMLGHFVRDNNRELHVLVATSGDTGSAVANGFLGVEGIRVHVLYPSGMVSKIQEKQFTTLGRNITALEVDGSFDDCQALVKQAFSDEALRARIRLTSANSINLARLLPQSIYYLNAWGQVPAGKIVFSVPSGNYGNLTAGLIAREMGLPADTFLAASNANSVVPDYLASGTYRPRASVRTIANAMDVGSPSNFERILDLFDHDHKRITRHLAGYSYSDDRIREIISRVCRESGYIPDTHGATGYEAGRAYLRDHPDSTVIFLETAHPAKFGEEVGKAIGTDVGIPERLASFVQREKKSIPMEREYEAFRAYLEGAC